MVIGTCSQCRGPVSVPSHMAPYYVPTLIAEIRRLTAERDEARKDAAFHAECRPNRQQAEAAMADAKATNDRWADEVVRREQAEATIATLREQLQAAQALPPLPDDWELVGASEYQWTFNGSRVYVSPDGATRVTGGWYPPTHLIAVLRRAMQAHPTPAQEGQ